MKRIVAAVGIVAAVAVLFGAGPADSAPTDPLRAAALQRMADAQAAEADAALQEAEELMDSGIRVAGQAQAAVLAGDGDPVVLMDAAAVSFEAAAAPVDEAQVLLDALGWTLFALDPQAPPPTLELVGADLLAIGAQWRATALPLSALADLRRAAEATLTSLEDALAALEGDDPAAALEAVAEAEAWLEEVRPTEGDVTTLPFWVDTVDALLAATADIAHAVQAGDAEALAAAQAAYAAAAADAARADQALAIALGEATADVTGPASASSAAALRAVEATRAALGGLSILP